MKKKRERDSPTKSQDKKSPKSIKEKTNKNKIGKSKNVYVRASDDHKDEDAESKYVDNWICCDTCNKWRKIPKSKFNILNYFQYL